MNGHGKPPNPGKFGNSAGKAPQVSWGETELGGAQAERSRRQAEREKFEREIQKARRQAEQEAFECEIHKRRERVRRIDPEKSVARARAVMEEYEAARAAITAAKTSLGTTELLIGEALAAIIADQRARNSVNEINAMHLLASAIYRGEKVKFELSQAQQEEITHEKERLRIRRTNKEERRLNRILSQSILSIGQAITQSKPVRLSDHQYQIAKVYQRELTTLIEQEIRETPFFQGPEVETLRSALKKVYEYIKISFKDPKAQLELTDPERRYLAGALISLTKKIAKERVPRLSIPTLFTLNIIEALQTLEANDKKAKIDPTHTRQVNKALALKKAIEKTAYEIQFRAKTRLILSRN